MYRSLLVLATGVFAVGTDSFVIAGILPDLAASLGVGTATAGQLISGYALIYAVLSPVMAAATTRWRRKHVLLVGLGVFTAGNLVTAFVPSYEAVMGGRILAGVGAAMITPAATTTAVMLAPEAKRGRAIATVMTGLSAATALGSPIGTALSSATNDWRVTMMFVVVLGVLAAAGVAFLLPPVAGPPSVGIRERLAPIGDLRITLTLATTALLYGGLYTVYSYISLSFDRVTGGSGTTLAVLLFIWGAAATVGTLGSGVLIDRFGNRRVINTAVTVAAVDFVLLPWTSQYLITAVIALIVWGICGWGALTPQTHRLIEVMPPAAPLLTGLGSATVYIGVSAAPAIGAVGLATVGPYYLGPVGAVLIALALVMAELAYHTIRRRAPVDKPVKTPVAQA